LPQIKQDKAKYQTIIFERIDIIFKGRSQQGHKKNADHQRICNNRRMIDEKRNYIAKKKIVQPFLPAGWYIFINQEE